MSSRRPLVASASTLRGLPGSSTDLSTRAVPNHPGRSDSCLHLLLRHRSLASPQSAGWPPSYSYRGRIGFTCVTARVFAYRLASRIAAARGRSATCRTGNLHGELLSVHKISQAYPGLRPKGAVQRRLAFASGGPPTGDENAPRGGAPPYPGPWLLVPGPGSGECSMARGGHQR